ncbi:hypothetical protein BTHE_1915 [Bifidobacterium thermophilum]|nr:hypothetical protein BTHE_1915 [Bifidobacterium thermophilum]
MPVTRIPIRPQERRIRNKRPNPLPEEHTSGVHPTPADRTGEILTDLRPSILHAVVDEPAHGRTAAAMRIMRHRHTPQHGPARIVDRHLLARLHLPGEPLGRQTSRIRVLPLGRDTPPIPGQRHIPRANQATLAHIQAIPVRIIPGHTIRPHATIRKPATIMNPQHRCQGLQHPLIRLHCLAQQAHITKTRPIPVSRQTIRTRHRIHIIIFASAARHTFRIDIHQQ